MRITTNALMRKYGSALNTSLANRSDAMEKVYTQRKFTKAYQDPAGAKRIAELNRSYYRTEVYINNVEDAQSRLDSAEGALLQITQLVGSTLGDETLSAINGPNAAADTRNAYAETLSKLKDTLIQFSNATYQEHYLFAGADGDHAAFTTNDKGELCYRGINVSTQDPDELKKLAEYASEPLYLDIGLGMLTDTGDLMANKQTDFNGTSAYNTSMPGVEYFGYGTVDGTDISKNLFDLLGQMSKELEQDTFDFDRFTQMRTQLKECHDQLTRCESNLGINSNFLENTKERMETNKISIYKEIDSVINIEPETAIMDYSYAQYAYNMILKVGTSLLSSSLVDYLK